MLFPGPSEQICLSALVLANILPLDYSIKEWIGLKVLLQDDFPIALSSSAVVNNIVSSIRKATPPQNCNYTHFCCSALRDKLTLDWNKEWITSSIAPITRLFFSTVAHSAVLAKRRLTAATFQILTGHSILKVPTWLLGY